MFGGCKGVKQCPGGAKDIKVICTLANLSAVLFLVEVGGDIWSQYRGFQLQALHLLPWQLVRMFMVELASGIRSRERESERERERYIYIYIAHAIWGGST